MIAAVKEVFAKSKSCKFSSVRSKNNLIKKIVGIVDEYVEVVTQPAEVGEQEQVVSAPKAKGGNYHMKVADSIHRPRPEKRKGHKPEKHEKHGITVMTEQESREGDKHNPFD